MHDAGTERDDGEERDRMDGRVRQQQCDGIAALDPERRQAAGDLCDPAAEVGIGDGSAAKVDRRLGSERRDGSREERGQGLHRDRRVPCEAWRVVDLPGAGHFFSLSPRERAGVRPATITSNTPFGFSTMALFQNRSTW